MKNIFNTIKEQFQLHIEYDTLDGNLEEHIKKVNQQIKRRDLLEYLAIIFVFTTFSYQLFCGVNSTYQYVGLILILTSCFVVAYVLFKNKSRNQDELYTLPFKSYLEKQKSFLENQIKLLDNVLYWYLGLPTIGLFLIQIDGSSLGQNKIIYLTFVFIFFLGIVWINKRAARSLEPYLNKINTSLDELEEDEID